MVRNTKLSNINIFVKNYLSFADPDAGLRLLNAFNHFVFIDVDDTDIFRSPLLGELSGSTLLRNSSFYKWKSKMLIEDYS